MTGVDKLRWVKPVLKPHRTGGLNKFGALRSMRFRDEVEGVPVEDLLRDYGSPLFVISERRLRNNTRTLRRMFSTRYRNVLQAWSYKTNYLGAVCNVLHQEGSWAEVVSAFEYEKARALGVPGDRILFNGPHKPKEILTRAAREGARIHLDNMDEIHMLEEVAAELGIRVPVTMRLTFDTGYTEAWTRFGFHIESGEAMDAAKRIHDMGRLHLKGLHSHIGTFVVDPRAYAAQVRIMTAFMDDVEKQTDAAIDSIDIGGGFPSLNALQGVYLPKEQFIPPLERYADAICDALIEGTRDRQARGMEQPRLILETGRAVVDDSEVLISSVVANKRLADGRQGIVMDAGVNLLFTSFWYNHEVEPTRMLDGLPEETVLYGPLCMNIDVMRQHIMMPPLKLGDSLIFSPAGAYNNTQWLQFIEYRPNVVMVHEDGSVSVVREAETLDTVIGPERMPEHLKEPFPGN
ncbi:MAG: alanine racemase [Magnetococcales bacterium]|nr:alanine racemase [Magnetococcales bacterium]